MTEKTAKAKSTRAPPPMRPKAIVIGASAGGPEALATLFQSLAASPVPVPIFLVLHMPADFSATLVTYIERVSGRPTSAATDGATPQPGHIYVAPAGQHLRLSGRASRAVMQLDSGESENFCRPAADVLFRSAATTYTHGLLALVLTGTGQDGLAGSAAVVAAGGMVIAQDETSSAAWGMPGAVVEHGHAAMVLPIDLMGPKIASLFRAAESGRAA